MSDKTQATRVMSLMEGLLGMLSSALSFSLCLFIAIRIQVVRMKPGWLREAPDLVYGQQTPGGQCLRPVPDPFTPESHCLLVSGLVPLDTESCMIIRPLGYVDTTILIFWA